MVVETIAERERISEAVINAMRTGGRTTTYAVDLLDSLQEQGIDPEETISTVWRLIDENRLFLDKQGALNLDAQVDE